MSVAEAETDEQLQLDFPEGEEQDQFAGLSEEDARRLRAADQIRLTYKGIKVTTGGLGQSSALSGSQKRRAAEVFGTEPDMFSGSSMKWDAREPLIKDVRSILSAIGRAWHDRTYTIPTTTKGIRKVKKDCVDPLESQLERLEAQLAESAQKLEDGLTGMLTRLRESKKELFNPKDYEGFVPTQDIYVKWSFPIVDEPDQELAELSQAAWNRELQQVRIAGIEGVRKLEDQFAEDMSDMLDVIVFKLEGNSDKGGRKKIYDTQVANVFERLETFNEQLKEMEVGGEALSKVMGRLSKVVSGHDEETFVHALRGGSDGFREHCKDRLGKLSRALVAKAVPEKRRNVLRKRSKDRRK